MDSIIENARAQRKVAEQHYKAQRAAYLSSVDQAIKARLLEFKQQGATIAELQVALGSSNYLTLKYYLDSEPLTPQPPLTYTPSNSTEVVTNDHAHAM